MHAPSIWGVLIVAVVVLLLFGRGKIAGMMGEVASGIKSFQRGLREEDKPRDPPAVADAAAPITATEAEKARDV
jgi:sec-independent protein translocase protein TatA